MSMSTRTETTAPHCSVMSKQPANQPGSSPLPLLAVGFFIGGLITSTIVTLEIVPAIYSLWRGRQVEWVKGPKPPHKKWEDLSMQFMEWEKQAYKESLPAQAESRS
jgi:hypothetical protein